MRVASKVGNLTSEFGHAGPLGSRIIRYVRDGLTDRRADGQKQHLLPLPYGRGLKAAIQVQFLLGLAGKIYVIVCFF